MTVAILINDEQQTTKMLPWGFRFAQAEKTDLLVIVPRQGKATASWEDVELATDERPFAKAIFACANQLGLNYLSSNAGLVEQVNEEQALQNHEVTEQTTSGDLVPDPERTQNEATKVNFMVREFEDPDLGLALPNEIETLSIGLLVIPHFDMSRSGHDDEQWERQLFRRAPCETMFLRDDMVRPVERLKSLVITTGAEDDAAALKAGYEFTSFNEAELTAIYVQPDLDVVSRQVGERSLEKIVNNALGREAANVQQQVIMANRLLEGVKLADPHQYDAVFMGTRSRRDITRLMNVCQAAGDVDAPAVCAIRRSIPLTNRLINDFQRVVRRFIPQLTREERVSLVERVQSSSQWDFDFIALICLSTLIAGLGLYRDSSSVVIGAMLVAPLMTPIAAAGLGIAHGNLYLIKTSLRTVFRGFALAFVIGVLVGFSIHTFMENPQASNEMKSRGDVSFIDLIVALVSGVAAAYAMGRTNLLSAIPGVAIAAALVPPLATSGMSVSLGEWNIWSASMMLFLTNMVAIILGTTVTFWMVGVTGEKKDKLSPAWPRWILFALMILTVILIAIINYMPHRLAN